MGNPNTVSVLLNTTPAGAATPLFAAPQSFPTGTSSYFVAVGDFNNDGRPDLVVAHYISSNNLSVMLNTTAPGSATLSFGPSRYSPS